MKTILDGQQLELTIRRLAHQIAENHTDIEDTVVIGLQPRGIKLKTGVYNLRIQ